MLLAGETAERETALRIPPVFRALASFPRAAGSDEERAARRLCKAALEARGFRVVPRPFEYSAWPGRYGTPVAGGALLLAAAAVAWFGARAWVAPSSSRVALLVMVAALPLGIALGGWWVARWGTSAIPYLRHHGVNLEATRGGDPPMLWLVAHLDSKSQGVPMLLRIAGVTAAAAAWAGVAVLLVGTVLAGSARSLPLYLPLYLALCGVAGAGALPLLFARVGNHGAGALDNASGVATLLAALDDVAPEAPVGVLVTSAEELGLAGARAWLRGRPPAAAINCDSIDDTGQIVCMLPRGERGAFLPVLAAAGVRARVSPVVRGVLPGILLDAVAFSDAGWSALTVSRGDWRSLARVHTRRDTLGAMRGAGIAQAAGFVAALAGAIIAEGTARTRDGTRPPAPVRG